ncbi:MAG: hypothetical protein WD200_03425 [Candidatus Andersenbacteria bacterium]
MSEPRTAESFWPTLSRWVESDRTEQPLLVTVSPSEDTEAFIHSAIEHFAAKTELHHLKPDGHTIKIKQVRELLDHLTRTSFSDKRLIVIEPVDRIQITAANALLKELEESSSANRFLLLTAYPGRVLPTIVSRCQTLRAPGISVIKSASPIVSLPSDLLVSSKKETLSSEELETIGSFLLHQSRTKVNPYTKLALMRLRDYYKIRASRGNEKMASTVLLATLRQLGNT